ncbi:MAG TPA: NifU N-terminal domain-containing protein [Acidimicrobiales bacterium]|nr:NifU N-terminal domain-containing protein [Acidimicrobiales bacterium]
MEQDAARRLVVERNLAGAAFGHLTEAFMTLPFESLGPVKTLLKRYLSTGPWSADDDEALAGAVGPGEGWWQRELDGDLSIAFGWEGGRFRADVVSRIGEAPTVAMTPGPLDATFDGPVVPEATPNPRTIRFGFGHPVNDGPSRWYESAASAADDPPVARLFHEFEQVANVLVGPDFIAVGLRRPGDWEALLAPVLSVVTDEFGDPELENGRPAATGAAGGPPWLAGQPQPAVDGRRLTRLEQAWRDLGGLRPADPADLTQVLAAAADPDQARRQVAAYLLKEAEPAVAQQRWAVLVADPVRAVRRAAVDAMVDAGRDGLRPLLESALGDADAWVRWKALRGLAELGPAPSRAAITEKADDPDFRVRLEAAAALRTAAQA